MRATLAALALIGLAGTAEAAVYTYDYQGQYLHCVPIEADCSTWPGQEGYTGTISIDTKKLGRNILGSTLDIYIHPDDLEAGDPSLLPAYLKVTGGLWTDFFTLGWIGGTDLSLTFDLAGNITSWWGQAQNGGTGDPYLGMNGDGIDGIAQSAGPGSWTLVSVKGGPKPKPKPRHATMHEPAPVPLPAAAPLFLLALGGLGLTAMRRRS